MHKVSKNKNGGVVEMEEQKKVVENKPVDFISRQQRRQQEREDEKYNKMMKKQLAAMATKGDLMMLVEAFNKLRDRLFQMDIINSALEKIIINKGLATRDEIMVAVKCEADRAMKMKEVNDEKENYEKRLETCLEFDIDPNFTSVPLQIFQDTNLTVDQKRDLAVKYNLETVLEKLPKEESKEVIEQKEKIVKLLDEIKPKEEKEKCLI